MNYYRQKYKTLPTDILGESLISSTSERMRVIDYLQNVNVGGMRKHLCFSCSFVKLYDKNNKEYKISRKESLAEVKLIIEEIRKVNQADV